jgi:hypothetical protein
MLAPYKTADLDLTTELPDAEPWRRHLLQAADLIRERGLAKFVRKAADGSLCVHGAVAFAISGSENSYEPVEALQRLGHYLIDEGIDEGLVTNWYIGFDNISDWNNAPKRTAAEVIAALEGAALR